MYKEELHNNSTTLLKASDVARKLNISRSMAYQLMKWGEIPTVKIRRSVRVLPTDLDEYIYKCRVGENGNNSSKGEE